MRTAPFTPTRWILLSVLALAPMAATAQKMVSTRITATAPTATFWVDGAPYKGSATLLWADRSQHILEVRNTTQAVTDSYYEKVIFTGWNDPSGVMRPSVAPVLRVVADASFTNLEVKFDRFFRVDILVGDEPLPRYDPLRYGFNDLIYPDTDLGARTGFVMTWNSECLHRSVWRWAKEGTQIKLSAFAYPGYVFRGWSPALPGGTAQSVNYLLAGPIAVRADFTRGRRVTFQTSPPGLKILVNRSPVIPRVAGGACLAAPFLPSYPSPDDPSSPYGACQIVPACDGDFDFVPGTPILLSAPVSQEDAQWKIWTLESWSVGGGQDTLYTVPNGYDNLVITAKFAPATRVNISTTPPTLKVSVNGRNNYASPVFTFAVGSKQKFSAPPEQTDPKGRRYKFVGWSNEGPPDQELEIPADGLSLMATYQLMGRLMVQTEPSGMRVQIGDTPCQTPCTLDRTAGTEIGLTAEALRAMTDDSRFEFEGWKDGAGASRTYKFTENADLLVARYKSLHRLLLSSDPPDGVNWKLEPASEDRFYAAGSQVTIQAEAREGFKFRRWDGALSGTYPMGWLTMNTPQIVVAKLDKVPHISPASVRNAAGETPEPGVAPGSMIAINGQNLALEYVGGPENPLAQTLGGVVVTLGDRILPLASVSPEQIIAQMPSDVPLGDQTLSVRPPGQPVASATVPVVRNNPGLYRRQETELAIALAIREKGGLVAEDNPVKPGEIITLLGTGLGPMNPMPLDGFQTPSNPDYSIVDPVEVLAMDQVWVPLTATGYSGPVGWQQVRVRIADEVPRGTNLSVTVRVNGRVSNVVLVPIEP